MNVFAVLIDPEREEAELSERALVCSAANVLQVGEFQFLRLAYRKWSGEDLPDAVVDGLFAGYMLRNEVPHWARHYARSILAGATAGATAGNNGARPPRAKAVRSFCGAAAIVGLVVAAVIAVASMTTGAPTSMLPPYFQRDQLPHPKVAPKPAAADEAR